MFNKLDARQPLKLDLSCFREQRVTRGLPLGGRKRRTDPSHEVKHAAIFLRRHHDHAIIARAIVRMEAHQHGAGS